MKVIQRGSNFTVQTRQDVFARVAASRIYLERYEDAALSYSLKGNDYVILFNRSVEEKEVRAYFASYEVEAAKA